MEKKITAEDYRALSSFRHNIRGYIRFSEKAVRDAELEPREYQLLLALKGLAPKVRPRIVELAEQLQIHHHSAVELVNRLENKGLVKRERGKKDRCEVLVIITPAGEATIGELVSIHIAEVATRGPVLLNALQRVMDRKRSAQLTKKKWTIAHLTPLKE